MAKRAKHLEVKARYIYNPEIEVCLHCGEPLQARRHYQWRKTVQQLDGAVYVASQARECVNPGCEHQDQPYTSVAAQMVTVPGCTYGLDVIAQIGWWRDREHLNREQIHTCLQKRGVQICEREVDHLYARYQVLLGCAERLDAQRWQEVAEERGGLIISLDGLEPEGASEQLWVVREVQEESLLAVAWLPRVNHKTLAALLKPVVDLGLPILATVSDKQGCARKALHEVLPDVPHQWCQSHYLSNATRPIYDRDSELKTELRQTIRGEIRESMGEVLSDPEGSAISPQIVTGLAIVEPLPLEQAEQPATRAEVVRDLALDLRQALSRKGRAPFIMSGLPMFDDLRALRQTLAQCLTLGEDSHLRHWHTVLDGILPSYESAFTEVGQALDWMDSIETILDVPLPTTEEPGPSGDAIALDMAHYLGQLADLTGLDPWLTQCRDDLLAVSERYWSGLFHCYDIVGLPRTNNDHESLYGQTKRQLRRQLGVKELREPLLRRGAWILFRVNTASPSELRERLAQVSWKDYFAERARYERRQEQFRRRYRWRHHRDTVLQQRVTDWAEAASDC
jgi:hypothetical protein